MQDAPEKDRIVNRWALFGSQLRICGERHDLGCLGIGRHFKALSALRLFRVTRRRVEVVALLKDCSFGCGSQSRIAERLGVHRSTICRDMAKLHRWRHGEREAEQRYLAEKRMMQYVRAEDCGGVGAGQSGAVVWLRMNCLWSDDCE